MSSDVLTFEQLLAENQSLRRELDDVRRAMDLVCRGAASDRNYPYGCDLAVRPCKYRELIQNANSAIVRWRRGGAITFANDFALEFFGYRADELIGKNVEILFPERESSGADLSLLVRDIVDHPDRYADHVNENVCRDGRRVWLAWTNTPLLDENGQVAEILAVGSDITRQKLAEQALRKSEADLKALNDVLEQRVAERTAVAERRASLLQSLSCQLIEAEERHRRYLARLLHDQLQQLLAAARIKMAVLRRRCTDEDLIAAVDELDDLVRQSIDESRSLTTQLSPPVLYDAGLVAGLRWLAREMGEKHGLEVDVQAEPDAEPDCENTRVFLFQAVRELLLNVLRHAEIDSACVELAAPSCGCTRIRVSDLGIGFDPSLLARHQTTRGFGLFSLRERLDLLGGSLHIVAAPGRGTEVVLEVPTTCSSV
ncbi:MAG: PAS domain S-box protein [Rhodopirellula sp.]|nr:PAS domain S-box protein [Rhodopirellula sp.]